MIEETGDGERREALKRERSRQPGQPQEPKQYALVVALWPAGEWAAAVVEDELGLRVVHRHNPGCSDGSCGVDTTRPGWTVAEAIELAEKKRDEMLAASLPYWGPPASIDTIIEPTGDAIARRESTATDEVNVRRIVENLSDETGLQCHPHDVTVRRAGGELELTFHCTMEADTPITDAHAITEQVETVLRGQVPNLGRVVIHVEPTGA